jgi:hypothetical protein
MWVPPYQHILPFVSTSDLLKVGREAFVGDVLVNSLPHGGSGILHILNINYSCSAPFGPASSLERRELVVYTLFPNMCHPRRG